MNSKEPTSPSVLEDIFSKLPPVDSKDLPPLLNPNNGQCEMCKKFLPLKDMPVVNTGIVLAQEPLCVECQQTLKDQARIACTSCRLVVLWVDPHKEPSGFEFQRRKIYHIKHCPFCTKGLQKAQVLEKIVFYRENNIPFE